MSLRILRTQLLGMAVQSPASSAPSEAASTKASFRLSISQPTDLQVAGVYPRMLSTPCHFRAGDAESNHVTSISLRCFPVTIGNMAGNSARVKWGRQVVADWRKIRAKAVPDTIPGVPCTVWGIKSAWTYPSGFRGARETGLWAEGVGPG